MAVRLTDGYATIASPQAGVKEDWIFSMMIYLYSYPPTTIALIDRWALSDARSFQVQMTSAGVLTAYSYHDANFDTIDNADGCYASSYQNQNSKVIGSLSLETWSQVVLRVHGDVVDGTGSYGVDSGVVMLGEPQNTQSGDPGGDCYEPDTLVPSVNGISVGLDTTGIGIGRGSRSEWQQANQNLDACIANIGVWAGDGVGVPADYESGVVEPGGGLGFFAPTQYTGGLIVAYSCAEISGGAVPADYIAAGAPAALGSMSTTLGSECSVSAPGFGVEWPRWVRFGESQVFDGDRGVGLRGVREHGPRDLLAEPEKRDAKVRKP